MTSSNVNNRDAIPTPRLFNANGTLFAVLETTYYIFGIKAAAFIAVLLNGGLIYFCNHSGIGDVPDARFGFTEHELAQLFRKWGEQGMGNFFVCMGADFLLAMPSYFLLLICMATHLATSLQPHMEPPQRHRLLSILYALSLLVVAGDVVETGILLAYSLAYPGGIPSILIGLGSVGQRIKWVLLALVVAVCAWGELWVWLKLKSSRGTERKDM